jgi:hypothetical protein
MRDLWVSHERTPAAMVLALAGSELEAQAPDPFDRPAVAGVPRGGHRHGDRLARRILAYLARVPHGLADGQGRNDAAYRLACFLVRDVGLSPADAAPVVARWDACNVPPLGEARCCEILTNAMKYAKGAA